MSSSDINKDLILRENLAIERTRMANDRTLLSFIRTSLYFAVAGFSINSFLDLSYGMMLELIFWVLAILILFIGIIRYYNMAKTIKESRKNIGNYVLNV